MRLGLALIVLLLAGCAHDALKVAPPTIVRVEVPVPVSLCPEGGGDCALLKDCYNEAAKEQTYHEGKRLANLRDASIEECNARWAKVRAAQPARGAEAKR